jgi:hypothetical protein
MSETAGVTSKEENMLESRAQFSQFVEGSTATFVVEAEGFYLDIGITKDLKVSAYAKQPDGSERFVEEGTPIEDVDPDIWTIYRAMLQSILQSKEPE